MTTNKPELSAISFKKTTIEDMAAEILGTREELTDCEIKKRLSKVTTIDGGDHMVNIWKDATGKMKISIQATGEGVTLLTVDHPDLADMDGAPQWAGDDHAAASVRPH